MSQLLVFPLWRNLCLLVSFKVKSKGRVDKIVVERQNFPPKTYKQILYFELSLSSFTGSHGHLKIEKKNQHTILLSS